MNAYSTLSVNQQQTDRNTNKFFEYYKTVLDKVSFDHNLFAKEYRKAVNVLNPEERAALNAWIKSSERIIEPPKIRKQLNS
jgi:hypothetical protein